MKILETQRRAREGSVENGEMVRNTLGFPSRPRLENLSKIDNSRLGNTETFSLFSFKNIFYERTHFLHPCHPKHEKGSGVFYDPTSYDME